MTSKELEKVLLSEVSLNNILESVNVFSNLHRYSGTPQAEKAVDYLESKLNEYGVNYECCKYTGLFSIFLTWRRPRPSVRGVISSCVWTTDG